MIVKIKYLRDIEPVRKIAVGDWIDLRCAEDVYMRQGDYRAIPLGVVIDIPEGFEGWIAPRSSTFKRYGILMTNSIGVIDESYCGDNDELHFPAYATRPTLIKAGERICQLRLVRHQPDIEFVTVETMGNPDRGGLGSTGDN